ncbi:MAG: hypothetical protein Q4G68_05015 [Planctomycetia bacterium]|nr:hypothetical protein [Planctomycetia bacterium]
MDFNFFDWIRQGVRRSVLLGVSDAVTQMGMPQTEEDSRDKILSFLQTEAPKSNARRRLPPAPEGGPRKLGRTISDLNITAENNS